jgi:hypothetical protein
MRVAKNYSFLIFLLTLLIVSYFYFSSVHAAYQDVTSFDRCIVAGFKASNTYPETCRIPGKLFVNEHQKKDVITSTENTDKTLLESYKNLSYFFEDTRIDFSEGVGVLKASSSSEISFTILQPPLSFKDENGHDSLAFLLRKKERNTRESYYLSSATTLNTGSVGRNILLIDTQVSSSTSLYYASSTLVVQYGAQGTGTKTKYYLFENNILKEILIH